MSYSYIMLATAQAEYESSLLWYIERSEEAAVSFETAIDHTLELICAYPERWRDVYLHYHELGVKKYPFNLIYTIEEDRKLIIVHSIYHHSRNPKKKFKK